MTFFKSPPSDKMLKGVPYLDFIRTLSEQLHPRTYLEIGTNTGSSLAQVSCDAICIDPFFQFRENPAARRRRTLLFQMRSDEFFNTYDPRAIFPEGIDLAFLDGMHRFEFLLRDLINVEKLCRRRSLIIVHDCLPVNLRMAERSNRRDETEDESTRGAWTGDVWKLLPILAKFRPDLRVHLIDCPPTGLVAITNLDPQSTRLADSFYHIIDQFSEIQLEAFGIDQVWASYPMLDSRYISHESRLTSLFAIE